MHNATKEAIDFVKELIHQHKSVNRDDLIQAAVVSGFKHKTSTLFTALDYLILSGEVGRTKRGTYELVEQPEPEKAQEHAMSEAQAQVIEAYKAAFHAFAETNRIMASIDARIGELEKQIRRLADANGTSANITTDQGESTMDTITVSSATGRLIRARILRPGDSYGRNGRLKWGEDAGRCITDPDARAKFQAEFGQKLGIEFDDVTDGVANFTGGRYYLENILGHVGGLCLMGSEPAWNIPAGEMDKVTSWARTF